MTPKPKSCSRCHSRLASTSRTSYCKPCRAEYQREWRRRGEPAYGEAMKPPDPEPRPRLRGTPTHAEMLRYRLI